MNCDGLFTLLAQADYLTIIAEHTALIPQPLFIEKFYFLIDRQKLHSTLKLLDKLRGFEKLLFRHFKDHIFSGIKRIIHNIMRVI
jgi:hypothetical protein